MIATGWEFLRTAGDALVFVLATGLCLAGVLMSCLSLSGTWLVAMASILMAWLLPGPFPGIASVVAFLLIAIAVEVCDSLAGSWGVSRRGGSRTAGFMALVGGIGGMLLGGLIPPPLIGSLIGMLAGSFALAFLVERRRLRHDARAASIALGAVYARILVILLKVAATLGMAIYLLVGVITSRP